MQKNFYKKYLAIFLSALMVIGSGTTTFAQVRYNTPVFGNETSGNVVVSEDGVTINGTYYTKEQFKELLNQAIEVETPKNNTPQYRAVPIVVAGIYFIPGIGEIAITATGVVIVAGIAIAAHTWLYNTITHKLSTSQFRTIAKIKAQIPSRFRDENGNVNLGAFDKRVNGNKKVAYKEKGGWTIEKDETTHGAKKWKLKDGRKNRVASLDENGRVVSK